MKRMSLLKAGIILAVAAAGFTATNGWAYQRAYSIENTWYNYGNPDYIVGHTFVGCDGQTTSWGVVGDYSVRVRTPCD